MKTLSDMQKTLLSAEDLEKTRLCAMAMDLGSQIAHSERRIVLIDFGIYDPLHDDAQALQLVKRYTQPCLHAMQVYMDTAGGPSEYYDRSQNLNRAIVECVAKIEKGRPVR